MKDRYFKSSHFIIKSVKEIIFGHKFKSPNRWLCIAWDDYAVHMLHMSGLQAGPMLHIAAELHKQLIVLDIFKPNKAILLFMHLILPRLCRK